MLRRRHWKIHNLYSSNRRRSYKSSWNWEEFTIDISRRLQFIDRAIFMANSLSTLANKLSEEIHKNKCKYGLDNQKCQTYRIKYKYSDLFFEYTKYRDDLIEYRCLCCNKDYQ